MALSVVGSVLLEESVDVVGLGSSEVAEVPLIGLITCMILSELAEELLVIPVVLEHAGVHQLLKFANLLARDSNAAGMHSLLIGLVVHEVVVELHWGCLAFHFLLFVAEVG